MNAHSEPNNSRPLGKSLGAVVATACVAGFVGLIWLNTHMAADHTGSVTTGPTPFASLEPPIVDAAATASRTSSTTGYLHAPTSDPSLPSLEATFSKASVSADADEPAPSF